MHLSRITSELAKGDQCSLRDCQEDEAEIVDFIVNNPISLIRNLLAFSKLVFSHVAAVHIKLVQNLNKMADVRPNKNPLHQSVAIQRPSCVYPSARRKYSDSCWLPLRDSSKPWTERTNIKPRLQRNQCQMSAWYWCETRQQITDRWSGGWGHFYMFF